jgi:mono/diheme cytochrome c family protein
VVQEKCGTCHATADLTGLALSTYENALTGGEDGPVILPGDSANSVFYTLQAAGGHPGMFTPEELSLVQEWIDAGAVESAGSASGPVWEGALSTLLQEKCGTCHGPTAMGGLNLSTYADMLNGGQSGPVVVPGQSADSLLVSIQEAGGHPGQLTPEEIAQVIAWIEAGALEK